MGMLRIIDANALSPFRFFIISLFSCGFVCSLRFIYFIATLNGSHPRTSSTIRMRFGQALCADADICKLRPAANKRRTDASHRLNQRTNVRRLSVTLNRNRIRGTFTSRTKYYFFSFLFTFVIATNHQLRTNAFPPIESCTQRQG